YIVDSETDTIIEAAGGGLDRAESSVSYTLAANVENLLLVGSGDINGTGNELANRIDGNSGDNVLDGKAGNDVIVGGAGADTMTGGAGTDRFVYNALSDSGVGPDPLDQITDFTSGQDKIDLSAFGLGSITVVGAFTGSGDLEAVLENGILSLDIADSGGLGVGDGVSDLDIDMTVLASITEDDFILF
ncbi:MAG: M10 family metallopeptidase C-terminal domain-containing protein, partial [Rhodospirillales bacterium]|nr:M10 family metallopeptidase C-terminal domain-containing protein [Rhodospirillales bacterium]